MNDLDPQSQPWVREVESANAKNREAINRLRTNTSTQAKNAASSVSATSNQIPGIARQVQSTQLLTFRTSQESLASVPGTANQYYTIATFTEISPGFATRAVEFFVSTTVILNLTAALSDLGRARIQVNGSTSPGAVFVTPSGSIGAGCAYAGSFPSVDKIVVNVQVMLPSFSSLTGNTVVQTGLTAAWT